MRSRTVRVEQVAALLTRGVGFEERDSLSFFELATDRVMCREAQRTTPPSC